MYCSKKRREKINFPHRYKVSRLSAQISSGSAVSSDPSPSSETDYAVNRYADLNPMQRLALGVYMYDRLSVQPSPQSSDSGHSDSSDSGSGSDESSQSTSTADV